MWRIGCIIAEMARAGHPMFMGTSDIDQLYKIFQSVPTSAVSSKLTMSQSPWNTRRDALAWRIGASRLERLVSPMADEEYVRCYPAYTRIRPRPRHGELASLNKPSLYTNKAHISNACSTHLHFGFQASTERIVGASQKLTDLVHRTARRALLHPWLNEKIPPVFPKCLMHHYVSNE